MELDTLLRTAQLLVFVILGVAALGVWFKHRTRPASYLAAAFGVLGGVFLLARLVPEGNVGAEFVRDLAVAGLGAFPWLLASFAWSFESRLPRWLKASGALLLGLTAWAFVAPPLATSGDARSADDIAFVAVFVVIWAALSFAAAWRLWTAGGRQRLVRSRMRLMSIGAVTLTLTLLLGVILSTSPVVTTLLSIVAALLFAAGFAPPAPLRLWWRRSTTSRWQEAQVGMIAALTPSDVARAVTPFAAELLGGGVVIVGADGALLSHAGLGDEAAALLAETVTAGRMLSDQQEAHRVDDSWMVVQRTQYTPFFGADEEELIASLSLELRLALERAELFTAHQTALTAAEEANDELEAMLVGLSHDLRSPAVAIVGFAGLLRQVEDPEDRSQMLDDIETSARYVGRLVDALLELSRVGRTQLDVEPVELAKVVRTVANRLTATYPRMTVEIRPGLPTVLMNHARAQQLFDNLLGNAAKHSGRDDVTVTVEAGQRDHHDGLRLLVTDDGQGVHPDDRSSIFTLFTRARGAATDGNGVGLGFVRRIVERYGGSIVVTEHDGGAQFQIDLPADSLISERPPSSAVGQGVS